MKLLSSPIPAQSPPQAAQAPAGPPSIRVERAERQEERKAAPLLAAPVPRPPSETSYAVPAQRIGDKLECMGVRIKQITSHCGNTYFVSQAFAKGRFGKVCCVIDGAGHLWAAKKFRTDTVAKKPFGHKNALSQHCGISAELAFAGAINSPLLAHDVLCVESNHKAHGVAVPRKKIYVVQRLMSGSAWMLAHAQLSDNTRRGLARWLLKGVSQELQTMHGSNLVHRDIKLENILWDNSGLFCLGDFGRGQSVDLARSETIATTTVGYESAETAWRQMLPQEKNELRALHKGSKILQMAQIEVSDPRPEDIWSTGIAMAQFLVNEANPFYLRDIFAREKYSRKYYFATILRHVRYERFYLSLPRDSHQRVASSVFLQKTGAAEATWESSRFFKWFAALARMDSCFFDLLINDVLVPDPNQRITADQLFCRASAFMAAEDRLCQDAQSHLRNFEQINTEQRRVVKALQEHQRLRTTIRALPQFPTE